MIEVTSSNLDTFLKEAPSVPKVLLFTDKSGIPTIYKGLSIQFEVWLFDIKVKIILWYCKKFWWHFDGKIQNKRYSIFGCL